LCPNQRRILPKQWRGFLGIYSSREENKAFAFPVANRHGKCIAPFFNTAKMLPARPHTQSQGGSLMLVLSRKLNERIFIGHDITIMVTRLGNGQVRLGIEAPGDVLIRRSELIEQWEDMPVETTRSHH
jgi:carbon storage regulator CsrA